MTKHKPVTNELFPGRPDYTGPMKGFFAFLHHAKLFEISHDVMERVAYVKREKPNHEIPTRLHNMIYLSFMTEAIAAKWHIERAALNAKLRAEYDALDAKWQTERDALNAKWQTEYDVLNAKWHTERAALNAKCQIEYDALNAKLRPEYDALDVDILAYIREQIPDSAWNGKELVFPKPGLWLIM